MNEIQLKLSFKKYDIVHVYATGVALNGKQHRNNVNKDTFSKNNPH